MGKQYICSERSHYMCPNMHFAILAHVKGKADYKKIESCLNQLAKAHSFLRSVIAYEAGSTKLYYDIKEESKIALSEKKSMDTLWQDYQEISSKEWNVFANGLLKVIVYPIGEEMKILFISHHLLGDGRCLLELMEEFVQLYMENIQPVSVAEQLIGGIEDLPKNSDLTGISKCLVQSMNKKWRIEKAKEAHKQVQLHMENPKKLMLVLACYINMDQDLQDAVAMSTLGDFKSKAANFVGSNMFGFQKRDGISITNLGGIHNKNIVTATFIPPASPAAKLTIGVLTVNEQMQVCGSYYEPAITTRQVKDGFHAVDAFIEKIFQKKKQ